MVPITRRTALKASAAGLGLAVRANPLRAASHAQHALPAALEGERLFADVSTYVDFGVHHTGKAGDRATSDWQAEHLEALGLEVERQSFELEQFFEAEASLLLADGRAVTVAAQPPATTTDAAITAPLAELGTADSAAGAIVLIPLEGDNNTIDESAKLAQFDAAFEAGAAAVVVLCDHPSGRIQFGNVSDARAHWRVPLVLAGRADAERLRGAVGTPATLTLTGETRPIRAQNVQGRLRRSPQWIVVSTPQSGWTTCGGERGPGIAYFRALATWAAGLEGGPSWLFTSNSGHERHNLGARVAHEAGTLPRPEDTALWLHLGAGIAQRDWVAREHGLELLDEKSYTLASCDWRDAWTVLRHFWGTSTAVVPHQWLAFGELIEVVEHGYSRNLGVVSEQPYHHVPGDLANTTSPEILETVGRAIHGALGDLVPTLPGDTT